MEMMGSQGSTHPTNYGLRSCGLLLAQVICPSGSLLTGVSSPVCKNISVSIHPKSLLELFASHPERGAYHDRHETRGGMRWTRQRFARDGIAGQIERFVSGQQHADERCCCGRRSRVVLTPRRWRQVCGRQVGPTGLRQNHIRRRRWQKSPVTGESTKETVKTIACGNAG